jgi:hypothetical protein
MALGTSACALAGQDGVFFAGHLDRAPRQMKRIAYQALLANPQNVAAVRARKRDVERIGGRMEIAAPTTVGMVLVLLELPVGTLPEQFFAAIPFYPV